MTVPASVASRLWELGGQGKYQAIFRDLTLLCVAAARNGLLSEWSGRTGWQLRDDVCEALADESLVWRGRQGINAHGIWRAPDGSLVWWTNSDIGSAWCHVEEVARGTLDLLLIKADAKLRAEILGTGYRRRAA